MTAATSRAPVPAPVPVPAAAPRRHRRRGPVGSILVLTIVAIVMVTPMLFMVVSSFKPDLEIRQMPPTLLPQAFSLENYQQLFSQFKFATLTVNSVIVALAVVALSIVLGGSAAYAFSRYPFRGSGVLLGLVLITRMVTPASLVLPLFLMMEALGLTNTLLSLILGITVLNLPFVVWILKPFFDAMPREVEEASMLDGLGPIGVWVRMALPLARPGIMAVALFSFIAAWTDLMLPMTMGTKAEGWTLTAGILQMQTGYKVYWGALMAGGVYLTLPAFLIAFALQKYLTRGLRAGY